MKKRLLLFFSSFRKKYFLACVTVSTLLYSTPIFALRPDLGQDDREPDDSPPIWDQTLGEICDPYLIPIGYVTLWFQIFDKTSSLLQKIGLSENISFSIGFVLSLIVPYGFWKGLHLNPGGLTLLRLSGIAFFILAYLSWRKYRKEEQDKKEVEKRHYEERNKNSGGN